MTRDKLRESVRDIMDNIKVAADSGKLTATEIILSYEDIVDLVLRYNSQNKVLNDE